MSQASRRPAPADRPQSAAAGKSPAASSRPVRANQRLLAKQRTRERLLAAARALFAQRGYEGATVRDIAQGAGLSTGAVFGSFSDKADLFEAVLQADVEAMSAEMARQAPLHATIDDMLAAQFQVVLDHNLGQLPILKSLLAMNWVQDAPALARASRALQTLRDNIARSIELAISRRQLAETLDTPLIARLLWDAYLADLRGVVFFGHPTEEVAERQRRHAQVILRGYRPAAQSALG
ncbi:MAG: transcriptional regulator, TetR family [Caulobacteraceae bacterium]|nr:transcriptional regulator, TetR family [Caulobacteraceae bacterium]